MGLQSVFYFMEPKSLSSCKVAFISKSATETNTDQYQHLVNIFMFVGIIHFTVMIASVSTSFVIMNFRRGIPASFKMYFIVVVFIYVIRHNCVRSGVCKIYFNCQHQCAFLICCLEISWYIFCFTCVTLSLDENQCRSYLDMIVLSLPMK